MSAAAQSTAPKTAHRVIRYRLYPGNARTGNALRGKIHLEPVRGPVRAASTGVAVEPIGPQALPFILHPGPALHADPACPAGCRACLGTESGVIIDGESHLTSGLRVQEREAVAQGPGAGLPSLLQPGPARCRAPNMERVGTGPHLPSAFPATFACGTGCRGCPGAGRYDEPWQAQRGPRPNADEPRHNHVAPNLYRECNCVERDTGWHRKRQCPAHATRESWSVAWDSSISPDSVFGCSAPLPIESRGLTMYREGV